jgi:uncharacterized Zn-binding protein involved in type VI secretion
MPGSLLHAGATVLCAHGGQAFPTISSSRVMVSGQPIVTQPVPYTIAGCQYIKEGVPTPCIAAQWLTASTRVMSEGMPVLLMDSQAVCIPNGTPALIIIAQTRVSGI